MKKVLKIIFTIIKCLYIFMLIIYLGFICIHRISVDSDVLGYRFFTVENNEMSPKYKSNDIIVVKIYDPSKLKVGDNISYLGDCCGQGGMIVNHKIVKIDKEANKIVTKGINSGLEDPEIKYKQVIGKIIGILPIINFLHHILKNEIGFTLVVFMPLVIAIIVLIIKTIKDIKKEKLEKEPILIEEPVLIEVKEKKKKKKDKKIEEPVLIEVEENKSDTKEDIEIL